MIFKLFSGRREILFRTYIRANFKIGYTYKVSDIRTFIKILQKYLISTVSTTVAIHQPFSAHNQWTSLSELGDQFCLRVTFSGEIENSELQEDSKMSEVRALSKVCTALSMST